MLYRLFVPAGYDAQQAYPLILWLHGGGGAGSDNLRQILGDQIPGTRVWTAPAVQAKHPAFVIVPQSSQGWGAQTGAFATDTLSPPLAMALGILETLTHEFSLDRHRLYVAGQSDGGFAVWALVANQPERFAAAIPVCGGGNPANAARLVKVPIWAFHGEADGVIAVTNSRRMIAAITRAGGHPRYTEYTRTGHDAWTRAFAEPELVDWLFAQHN